MSEARSPCRCGHTVPYRYGQAVCFLLLMTHKRHPLPNRNFCPVPVEARSIPAPQAPSLVLC